MKLVPEPHRLRNSLITALALVCLFGAIGVLVKIPESVSGSCLLDSVRCWDLEEVRPGSYRACTEDLLTGELKHYRVYQFDRPSFVDLSMAVNTSGESTGNDVSSGQLLATAKSSSLAIELIEKQTDLAKARAELEVLQSGSKPAVIKRADLVIKLAKSELVAYQLQYNRNKDLFEQEILSSENWEASIARLDLMKLDVEIAEAEKAELTSGASSQMIEKAQTNIDSLVRELAALQEIQSSLEIRTPIAGNLSLRQGSGPLLRVAENDTMIARILIPQTQGQRLLVGQPINIMVPGLSGDAFVGEVLRIDQEVTLSKAGAYITVYGLLVNPDARLAPGMTGRAKILGETTSLLHQLKKEFISVVRQEVWPR